MSAQPGGRAAGRPDRARMLGLSLAQLVSGGTAFLVWALLSHLLGDADFATAQTALAWGMVGYLPLTLGMPFLLANYKRGLPDDQARPEARWTLRLVSTLGLLALAAGLVLAVAAAAADAPEDAAVRVGASAAALAGYAAMTTALQQQARLHRRLGWMALAVTNGLALPSAWLVATAIGSPVRWHTLASTAVLVLGGLAVAGLLARSERGVWGDGLARDSLRSCLRAALPLVPHMLAFSLMLQGTRLAGSLVPGWTAADVRQAGYHMLVLGVGFAVVTGIHGLIAASLQRATAEQVRDRVHRYAAAYAALGAAAALGVLLVAASPLRRLLAGMERPDGLALAALVSVPAALTAYFFLSTLLVRHLLTRRLALVSITGAAVFLLASRAWPEPDDVLTAYAASFVLLPALALPLAVRALEPTRVPRLVVAAIPALGLLPAAAVLALG